MLATQLDTLVASWAAQRQGLAPTAEAGVYHFVFDGATEVSASQDGPHIVLEAVIGELPKKRGACEALLEKLLTLQLGYCAAGAETVSLSLDGDSAILFIEIDPPDTPSGFDALLGSFVNGVEFWTNAMRAEASLREPAGALRPAQIMFP